MFFLILLAAYAVAGDRYYHPKADAWDTVTATAYAADCPGMADVLRDGSPADWTARSVAVDPRHYPLGSRVEVCFDDGSCRAYTARDTGANIKGPGRIDILVRSCTYARQFGRQQVRLRARQ